MPRIQRLRALQVFILFVLLVGCQKKASDEIDFGAFNKSVYSNNYFGLTIAVPEKWSVQDREAQQRLMKIGTDALAGSDKNLKAVLKASELQTVTLFAVFEHPLGTPVAFNPSIMGMAEMVRQMPGIRRGKDYHFQLKKTLASGQMQISFPNMGSTERLAGVEFDVLDQEMKVRGVSIRQRYYTIIKKGYALSFILSFTTDEEEAPLRKTLQTLAFN